MQMNHTTKGILLVLATAIISGVSIFANSYFVTKIDPAGLTFLKNSLTAAAVLGIILIGAKYSAKKNIGQIKSLTKKQWSRLVLVGLIGGSIPFLLFFEGLALIQGTSGALIHKTMFILVAIPAVLFLKEKIGKLFFGLALLLLTGNMLLLNADFSQIGIGHALVLAATIFWATENTYSKHLLKDINGTTLAFGRMFFGSIFILAYMAFTSNIAQVLSLNVEQWSQVLIASLFLIGYVLTWYNGLKYIPVTLATSILLIGAPITTFLNWIFLDKILTFNQITGSFIIIGALAIWIAAAIGKEKSVAKKLSPAQR